MSTQSAYVMRRFGSRHQTTEIARDEAGELWWTWSRTEPFALEATTSDEFPTFIDAACRNASGDDLIFRLPHKFKRSGHASWRVPGTTSAAEALLPRPTRMLEASVSRVDWERLGAALAIYHEQPLPGYRGLSTTPVSLVRLRKWMTAEVVDTDAGWRDELIQTLGGPRWLHLQRMAADLDADSRLFPNSDKVKLLHGWFSLGSMVLPEGVGAPTVLLSGPDICLGSQEYDLGTLIGELAEFAYLAEIQDLISEPYYDAARSVLRGYSARIDATLVHSAIVSRILLHTCDFATNIGWTDELSIYGEMLCESIDSNSKWLFSDI